MEKIKGVKPVNRVKLTDSIIKAIIDYVLIQNLKVGDKLPSERDLAKVLKVSRPLLREALRIMESLNLIEVVSGKGSFIKNPFSQDFSYIVLYLGQEREKVLEILKVRKTLEKLALEEAIKNITDEELKNLEKILNTLEEKLRRGENGLEENWEFHKSIYFASRNKFLYDFLVETKDFHLYWENPEENPLFAEKTFSHHRELFECIKRKDIEEAYTSIDRLYRIIEEEINKKGEV
ncbi:MAG: FadR/GntR family transcriptional regulator [Dictyoglomaceae bacterium]